MAGGNTICLQLSAPQPREAAYISKTVFRIFRPTFSLFDTDVCEIVLGRTPPGLLCALPTRAGPAPTWRGQAPSAVPQPGAKLHVKQ